MAKILSMQKPATATKENYFALNIDKQAPAMEKVLARLGIELEDGAVRSELETLYAKVANDGITKGRLTVRLPKGWNLMNTISAFDSLELRPEGVIRTLIDGGVDGETIGSLIRSGALDGNGRLGEVEFRILPCAEGYETRIFNRRRLEPVGLYYGKSQSEQKKLFAEYQKAYKGFDVEYATPMEIVISAMVDRECGTAPRSDDHTFNWGCYRTVMGVPGGVDRRLFVYSDDRQLWLQWRVFLDAHPGFSVVASVGVK